MIVKKYVLLVIQLSIFCLFYMTHHILEICLESTPEAYWSLLIIPDIPDFLNHK